MFEIFGNDFDFVVASTSDVGFVIWIQMDYFWVSYLRGPFIKKVFFLVYNNFQYYKTTKLKIIGSNRQTNTIFRWICLMVFDRKSKILTAAFNNNYLTDQFL